MDKSFLDKLSSLAGSMGINLSKVKNAISAASNNQGASNGQPASGNQSKTFTFQAIPRNVQELQALPEAVLTDAFATAALTVLALSMYEADRPACIDMLNFLKGPDNLSTAEIQFINDRLMDGKSYKLRAYFEGSTPANNYTPAYPYRIRISSTPYSFSNENWATLYVHTAGADNPRQVRLRKKPSTGQWFLVEIQFLSDIRTPVSQDKWA